MGPCGRRMQLIIDEYRCMEEGEGEEGDDLTSLFRQAVINMKLTITDGAPAVIPSCGYLSIGSVGAAFSPKTSLQNLSITHIVNATRTLRCKYLDSFTYYVFDIDDTAGTSLFSSPHIDNIFDLIEQARVSGGRVLVHCFQGRSRSVSICIAYLIKYRGHSYESALDVVRSVRPIAQPSHSFEQQLLSFEQTCHMSENGLRLI